MKKRTQSISSYEHLQMLDDETMEMLREYSDGSPEVIRDIIDSFEPEAGKLLEEINLARKNNDPQLLRIASHSLAGISGSIGAVRLKQIASDTENAVKAGKAEQAFLISNSIDAIYKELLQLLTKM